MNYIKSSQAITPEFMSIKDWCNYSGTTRTFTYMALSEGLLRAVKCGRRTLIHVPSGIEHIKNLPPAKIRLSSSSASAQRAA
jgi:excisionase family DNA binding protein